MKNQYFGDTSDYRKYGLLRLFLSAGIGKLLVVWMLTPEDCSSDGSRRTYLTSAPKWRHYDPELYDGLCGLLGPSDTPHVSLIENSKLLPHALFYSAEVLDRRDERDSWRKGMLELVSKGDVVFLDPDNGIEISSKPVGRKGSSKFVTWDELKQIWEKGRSLIIYQHFPRKPREAFAAEMVSKLQQLTTAPFVEALRTAHVLFLIVSQVEHESHFRKAIANVANQWDGQIKVVGGQRKQ